ncbi:D-alanyl-D-alanine carboxypeptidase [Aureimonas fodinaquatilis]|uniref:D-alanyl-D-alanine carboxypeptidase n=2 Tax=Aureimonas fodinaquatilis TaxID=2565783 RepID=A0A5B0DXN0_9HYPH|nr:serine hydrolase [Aureimonas fodinaquatilis]KAA0971233.1 D-alanyl-D-alanine carboxypeptidase [Aureimonas fodinaquatilis]
MGQQAAANEKYAAFVIDANNGKVLFNRYADDKRYPASLTKMMTLYMMFEALETGRAKLSTPMKVSAFAASRPPTKLGVRAGSTLSVEEAIYGLITRSANDASAVIAEYLGGSEARFAEMMTAKARGLGMSRTTFRNPHGLPNPGQSTTARDMATLGISLREHFPQYYKYFSASSFNFRGQTIRGHNRLLGRIAGVDGIKTGYINASGYNLVSSVSTGNKRLVAVVMGGRTGATRDAHMAELIKEYLPQATTRKSGPLIASWTPGGKGAAPSAGRRTVAALPDRVPVPTMRAASIDARVASAYGSNAAGAVNQAIAAPASRPAIGQDALRNALNQRAPAQRLTVPTANALAPETVAPSPAARRPSLPTAPIPRASIPNAPRPPAAIPSASLDARPTGSVAQSSGWMVQIASTPAKSTAIAMLNEARQQTGNVLANAQALTEVVSSGPETLYRARFAGFSTQAEADDACTALRSRSFACYSVAN